MNYCVIVAFCQHVLRTCYAMHDKPYTSTGDCWTTTFQRVHYITRLRHHFSVFTNKISVCNAQKPPILPLLSYSTKQNRRIF